MKRTAILLPFAALLTLGSAQPPRDLCQAPFRTPERYCTMVFFDFDSASVAPSAWPILDTVIGEVEDNEGAKIVLTGHTDTAPSRDYAISLSQRMTNSVRDYLVQHGVSAQAITAEAYGAERPRVKAAASKREPGNRRVEIWVFE